MPRITFRQEWHRWAHVARSRCVLCKVWALLVYQPGATVDVDDETAREAIASGAATGDNQ